MSTAAGNLGENILVLESVELQMSLRRKAGGLGVFEEINRKMPSVRKALVASLDTPPPQPTSVHLLHPGGYVEMHSKDKITNMRF